MFVSQPWLTFLVVNGSQKQRIEVTREGDQTPAPKVVLVTEVQDEVTREHRLTRIEWQIRALALFVAIPKLAGHDPSEVVTGAIQLLHHAA